MGVLDWTSPAQPENDEKIIKMEKIILMEKIIKMEKIIIMEKIIKMENNITWFVLHTSLCLFFSCSH